MLSISGFSVIKTADGNRISYTLTEKDEAGRILRSNIRKSFEVVDQETAGIISQLESKILQNEGVV